MSKVAGSEIVVPFTIGQTELLAGTSIELVAPVAGFLSDLSVIVQTAITTGGTVTVSVGTTTVVGLSAFVGSASTKGTVVTDSSVEGEPTRAVAKNGRIQVTPSANFDTAGALNGFLVIKTVDL